MRPGGFGGDGAFVGGRSVSFSTGAGRERRRRGGGGVGASLTGFRGPGDCVCDGARDAAMVEASSPVRVVAREANEDLREREALITAAVLAGEMSRGGGAGGLWRGREAVEALGP
jgi:hypothetical protein